MSDVNAGAKAAERRRGHVNRNYVVDVITKLRRVANELEGKLYHIPEAGSRRIDGATKAERGLTLLKEYVIHVEDAK